MENNSFSFSSNYITIIFYDFRKLNHYTKGGVHEESTRHITDFNTYLVGLFK